VSWPKQSLVARACSGGMAEVILTPYGYGKGLRSEHNWIYFIAAGDKSLAFCERCEETEKPPDPPGSGAPGEARIALLAPGTAAHALFILSWLHKWTAKHKDCEEKK